MLDTCNKQNSWLSFGLGELKVIDYSDVDLVGDYDDGKSPSCHAFLFGGRQFQGQVKRSCISGHMMDAWYLACGTSIIRQFR